MTGTKIAGAREHLRGLRGSRSGSRAGACEPWGA